MDSFDEINKKVHESLNRMFGMGDSKRERRVLAKLTSEEISRFHELLSRDKALNEGMKRARGKITSDRNRLWADIQDKHSLHGKDLNYNEETGEIFEFVGKEGDSED